MFLTICPPFRYRAAWIHRAGCWCGEGISVFWKHKLPIAVIGVTKASSRHVYGRVTSTYVQDGLILVATEGFSPEINHCSQIIAAENWISWGNSALMPSLVNSAVKNPNFGNGLVTVIGRATHKIACINHDTTSLSITL